MKGWVQRYDPPQPNARTFYSCSHPTRHWRPARTPMSGCNVADVSGLRIELPQVEETGCFGVALLPALGTGFITTSAKPNVTCYTGVPAAR